MTIPIKRIAVEQAEGRDPMIAEYVRTFGEATSALILIASRNRGQGYLKTGGYLKTDIVIYWTDGTTLGLRADVLPLGTDENDIDVAAIAMRWARCTLNGPPWASDAQRANWLEEMASLKRWPAMQTKARRVVSGELETRDRVPEGV